MSPFYGKRTKTNIAYGGKFYTFNSNIAESCALRFEER